MIHKKCLPTLLALPMFFMACGDDNSSSAPANNDIAHSCLIKKTEMMDGEFDSLTLCIELQDTETAQKTMNEVCYSRFQVNEEFDAKSVGACPKSHKKTCVNKDSYGNKITYYFYDEESNEYDCEFIIENLDLGMATDYQEHEKIFTSFDSEDTSKIDFNKLTENEKEFESIYEFLDNFYFFAHTDSLAPKGTTWYKQLSTRSAYKGKGKKYFSEHYDYEAIPSEILDGKYMAISLNDNFTSYWSPQEIPFNEFEEKVEKRDEERDFGISVSEIPVAEDSSVLMVQQVYFGSSARAAGIHSKDTIVSLMGNKSISEESYYKTLKERKGKTLDLVVARNENGKRVEKKFSIKEQTYAKPSVKYYTEDSIAHIKIVDFSTQNTATKGGTYEEFLDALEKTENTKATIIDLRGNPGGESLQCDSIARSMVHKNDTIAMELIANYDNETQKPIWLSTPSIASEDGLASDRYIVFLANESSASCAEYTLMGVTNARKSPIIGTTTYGKGSTLVYLPTYLYGAIMTTVGLIIDKDLNTYHMHGILPDIEEQDSVAQEKIAYDIAKEGTMKRTKGYGDEFTPSYSKVFAKRTDDKHIPSRSEIGLYRKFKSVDELKRFYNR